MTRPEGMLQIFAPMGSIALYVMSERFVPERLDCLVGIQAVNLGPSPRNVGLGRPVANFGLLETNSFGAFKQANFLRVESETYDS